jgi:hypothetical protein
VEHRGLVLVYAFAVIFGGLPAVLEGTLVADAQSRRFVFERILAAEWIAAGALTAFIAVKRMRTGASFPRVLLFPLEVSLLSIPVGGLLLEMGAASPGDWMVSRLELFLFLSMLAAVAHLLCRIVEPPLAALGASLAAGAALGWLGGSALLSLAVGSTALALLAWVGRRRPVHE